MITLFVLLGLIRAFGLLRVAPTNCTREPPDFVVSCHRNLERFWLDQRTLESRLTLESNIYAFFNVIYLFIILRKQKH